MTLHQTIKEQIKDALRAKDTIRLDTLRGLNALALNEMMSGNIAGDFLADDKVMAIIKRSVKQHRDSIEQFEKGGRTDLVSKEKAELIILESFMPAMMSYDEVKIIVRTRVDALKSQGGFDPKATGKIVGMLIKELAGKADGMMVKKAVDELVSTS
ncbi:MAG: GatB/YqeY domain-containing protein [Patescibacteria group bacterium]